MCSDSELFTFMTSTTVDINVKDWMVEFQETTDKRRLIDSTRILTASFFCSRLGLEEWESTSLQQILSSSSIGIN